MDTHLANGWFVFRALRSSIPFVCDYPFHSDISRAENHTAGHVGEWDVVCDAVAVWVTRGRCCLNQCLGTVISKFFVSK